MCSPELPHFPRLRHHLHPPITRRSNESLQQYTSNQHKKSICPFSSPKSYSHIVIADKNEWINTERIRWARLFDIRMAEEKPEGFPVNTLSVSAHRLTPPTGLHSLIGERVNIDEMKQVQRALCMITLLAPKFLPDILAALYHDFFVERKAIQKFENFLPILKRILGEEVAQEVLAKVYCSLLLP